MTEPGGSLLERERELEVLGGLNTRLIAGRGGLVVLEGPAGIGKTALVAATCERAQNAGTRVLRARGGALELDDAFGVVQQLFGPPLPAEELAGLPGPAAAALGAGDAPAAPPGEDVARVAFHAFLTLCARLAADHPLLLAVDDAHWADERSLRWLVFVARRLDRAPIGLVVARRPREPGAERDVVDRLAAQDGAVIVRPAPLSVDATAAVITGALGAAPDEEFGAACRRASGGNPFLLRALLGELRSANVAPEAGSVELALSIGPESVARATLVRLSRAGDGAVRLARALAVLEDAEMRDAARLAELDQATASVAAVALGEAGLLGPGRALRFAHPLVRSAIYNDLDPRERARSHGVAAAVLSSTGAAPERIAAHLLAADPASDPSAVAVLRAAARRAYRTGAPETAARYLRRALDEPPPDQEYAAVLLELGRAEVRTSDEQAVEHLAAAAAAARDSSQAARALRELARAHMAVGRLAEGSAAFEAAVTRAAADRELRLALVGELAATLANVTNARDAAAALDRYHDVAGVTPAERAILALLAFAAVQANEPASVAAELMERALRDGRFVLEQTAATVVFAEGMLALLLAEREERALECLAVAQPQAEALGWSSGMTAAPCFSAWAHLRLGNLDAARKRARASLAVSAERGWQALTPMVGAVLAETELTRGDVAAAAVALDELGLADDIPDSALFQLPLYARGLLRRANGALEGALADLLLCGQRELRLGGVTPAAMAWRSQAALVNARLGNIAAAQELADEEVRLAREFGAPRALGVALRAKGIVSGGRAGLDTLEEAAAALGGSPARVERAGALCELGAALRRANRRRDAREPLREGLALANACGARPLAVRAREELVAAGGRPRRADLRGPGALTPSERRVADRAAAGQSNRTIASELFVTVRTVEFHLSHAYAKLGVHSREELEQALKRQVDR